MFELDDVDSGIVEIVEEHRTGEVTPEYLFALQTHQDAAVAEAMVEKDEELAALRTRCSSLSTQLSAQGKKLSILYGEQARVTSLLYQSESAIDSVWSHKNPLVRFFARLIRWPVPDASMRTDFEIAMAGLTERGMQNAKWGEQHHPNGTGPEFKNAADAARDECDDSFAAGTGNWRLILAEEVAEAFAETNPKHLKEELTQVMAVCMAWIRDINSQKPKYRRPAEIRARKRRVDRLHGNG